MNIAYARSSIDLARGARPQCGMSLGRCGRQLAVDVLLKDAATAFVIQC